MDISTLRIVAFAAACATAFPAQALQSCRAASGPQALPLVELYTSEGCDSCPPADRWLAKQFPAAATDARALALAFHVDYWDRLGWADRFASPAYTERQYASMRANAATFVYTPQVLLQGHDLRGWADGGRCGPARRTCARACFDHARRGAERQCGRRNRRRRDHRCRGARRCATPCRVCRQRAAFGRRSWRESRQTPLARPRCSRAAVGGGAAPTPTTVSTRRSDSSGRARPVSRRRWLRSCSADRPGTSCRRSRCRSPVAAADGRMLQRVARCLSAGAVCA